MTLPSLLALCDRADELEAKATAGPWDNGKPKYDNEYIVFRAPKNNGAAKGFILRSGRDEDENGGVVEQDKYDASFIAHSRNNSRVLTSAIRELARRLEVAERALMDSKDHIRGLTGCANEMVEAALAEITAPLS